MSRMSELAAKKWEAEKSPRQYWTPAERAGLKNMGEWWKLALNTKVRHLIALMIISYVGVARKAKGEPR